MRTFSARLNKGNLTHAGLALVAVAILIAVLTGATEGWGIGDDLAFWALFLVGMTLCATGPLGQGATYGWWNPLHIAGYILGVAALLLGATILLDVSFPGIDSVQSAILVLAGLMVVKGVLAIFYRRPAS